MKLKSKVVKLNVKVDGKEHWFEVGKKLLKTKDNCWFIEFDTDGNPLSYFWWSSELWKNSPNEIKKINVGYKIVSSTLKLGGIEYMSAKKRIELGVQPKFDETSDFSIWDKSGKLK